VDGTIASYQLVSGVGADNGALTFNADGTYSFNPGTNFDALAAGASRAVNFTYTATDNLGQASAAKTVTITVTGTNDAPVVSAAAPSATLVEAGAGVTGVASATIALSKGDIDAGTSATYDTSSWTRVGSTAQYTKAGTYGTATLDTSSDVVTYALSNSNSATNALVDADHVTDSFNVVVSDGTASSNVNAVFNINGSNETITGALSALTDAGVASDNRTNIKTPTLVGFADPGGAVVVSVAGQNLATTANANGNWTVSTATLSDGTYTATINVTDHAGALHSGTATSFTLDTVAANLRMPVVGVDNLQTFYSARLLADGHTVELYFNEALDSTLSTTAIASRLSVQVAGSSGYTVAVDPNSITFGDSITGASGGDNRRVTFTLMKDVTSGLTTKVSYTDSVGEQTVGVLQDAAGNDVATNVWNTTNGSSVTVLTAATAAVKVFAGGLVGSTGDDTLTYKGVGNEFLTGSSGNDTVVIGNTGAGSSNDSSQNWYVAGYNAATAADLPAGVMADPAQTVFGFTSITSPTNSVYAQAENITLGGTHFTVGLNNVLQIADATGQTVLIDPEIIQPSSSISIGSGAGADHIVDSTDFVMRSDTVVYTSNVNGSSGVMASKAAMIAGIEGVVQVDGTSNELLVGLPGAGSNTVTDTLFGMERLSFQTASGTVNVALIGDSDGLNGYASLTDAAASPVDVLFVQNPALMAMDRASLITSLDGMFKTASGHLAFSLTPTVSTSFVTFSGTSKVVFEASGGQTVTVHVVGSDGYASIDAAMEVANAGDVVYITDNALTAATTSYTVFKENMTFIANHSTYNDQLTLQLGDIELAGSTTQPYEIKNLNLLGDANISVLGNQYDNHIVGNRGNNTIQGGDGDDVIATSGGVDRVYGGNGNDTLIATSGANDSTISTAAVLSGGAGNDTLIDATTDGHKVNMTGGTGADTFKVGGLSSDNGPVNVNAVITDMSARSGDVLDFTQILTSASAHATAANFNSTNTSYTGGNFNYNLSAGNFLTTATQQDAAGVAHDTTVGLTGNVQVFMTTTTNVNNALQLATAANTGSTVHHDVFGDSVTSEILRLIPILEHNPLG
jgi:VCBS repeat-containing protein